MIIEIDTDRLIKSNLSANQYLISLLIYQKAYNAFELMRLNFPQIVADDLQILINKGLLIAATNRMEYSVTDKFLEHVVVVDLFDELLNKYPVSVLRRDGTKDYLRTDKDRCRKRYARLTKLRKSTHQFIIKCLDFEVSTRTLEGSLGYMKRLPNWLESKEWEAWAERMEHETVNVNIPTYGTKLE